MSAACRLDKTTLHAQVHIICRLQGASDSSHAASSAHDSADEHTYLGLLLTVVSRRSSPQASSLARPALGKMMHTALHWMAAAIPENGTWEKFNQLSPSLFMNTPLQRLSYTLFCS